MHCTQCGAEGRGKFCGSCGASLRALRCAGCEETVQAGTRFCTACGTPVSRRSSEVASSGVASGEASSPQGSSGWGTTAGWWISGGLAGVLIAVFGFAVFGGSGSDQSPSAPPAPAAPGGAVDLSTMTPREAADRLFNRVMMAVETGDTAEVTGFLPMAMDAYELARPLDEDGLYHLSVLRRAAGEDEAALEAALEGLQGNPDHLLNLASAAEAARDLDQPDAAREYYERMLEAWDEEVALERLEYLEHAPLLPIVREEARSFLDQED